MVDFALLTPGTKVKIVDDLREIRYVVCDMPHNAGQVLTVLSVTDDPGTTGLPPRVCVEENRWFWTPEMIECIISDEELTVDTSEIDSFLESFT